MLADQLNSPPTMLVLDLTGVTFLSASGAQVLLEARGTAALTGSKVTKGVAQLRIRKKGTETMPVCSLLRVPPAIDRKLHQRIFSFLILLACAP